MGGGDLNLKKSWHPHTMKNQEKVWKAEQAKNEEDRKMNDLRREIMEERNREDLIKMGQSTGVLAKSDDKKLEWMYKSASELINREDYLLGRPIDKAFEMMEEEQKSKDPAGMKQPINHVEHECIPFSIRSYRNVTSTEQVDLQRKILEDPLMMIKQKEMESRRKILENPVKLKELHRILKIEKTKLLTKSIEAKSSKKSKKSKKGKKSKKKKRRSSDSDSNSNDSDQSDGDLDEMLQKQYKKLKEKDGKQLAGLDLSKLLDAKYETISKELDKAAQSKKKKKKGKSKKSRKDRSSSSESSTSSDSANEKNNTRSQREKSRSPVDERRNWEQRGKNSRRSPVDRRDRPSERRNWNYDNRNRNYSMNSYRTENRTQRRSRSRSRSPQKRPQPNHRRSRSPQNSKHTSRNHRGETKSYEKPTEKQRLTEEEKQQRLKDMMENASWRDKERTRTVQKYREGYQKEETQFATSEFDKEFINTQLRKAISSQNSVESRIKSNVNNIQRTSAAMNANFTRK